MTTSDYVSLAGVFATTVAIFVGIHVYRRQMSVSVFLECTRRYAESLRDIRLLSDEPDPFGSVPPKATPALTQACHRLLQVYGEEFYLARKGFIVTSLWKLWDQSANQTLASPLIQREWPAVRTYFAFFPEFVAYLDTKTQR